MMKKLFAMILIVVLVLSMAACSKTGVDEPDVTDPGAANPGSDNSEIADSNNTGSEITAPAEDLKTLEMTVEASGLEEMTKATIGVPKNMSVEEKDWCYVITDKEQNVEIEAYICCDYNCYDYNQEASKEEYEGYGEQKFGDFDGYYYISESGLYVEVYVYLGCVAEIDDVYLSFSVSALEGEADPTELYKLTDVQTILSSAVFYPAQEEAA